MLFPCNRVKYFDRIEFGICAVLVFAHLLGQFGNLVDCFLLIVHQVNGFVPTLESKFQTCQNLVVDF